VMRQLQDDLGQPKPPPWRPPGVGPTTRHNPSGLGV
jgi:hypothetical protein